METDRPDGHRGSRVPGLVAVAALIAVAAGGYFYYQSGERPDVTSELQQKPASPAPGTAGTPTPAAPANSAAKPASQPAATAANAPTGNPPNQGSQTPAPSANNAPAVPPRQAQTQVQAQAAPPAAPTSSGNAPAPAAAAPQSERTRPASLPTNDVTYVQRSRANIRSEPSARSKRVGQFAKGAKLNVLGRSGKWVQVESGETKGWISGRLLGPASP
jgi:hypothetical protein